MDRSGIAPYRAEERELSQILYTKIQGLALLYPMSDDLMKLHSEEMFVKPNQQAFFHVMHYLFRLLDKNDFKKRFYWPITDKKSESDFRTSTVEYLRFLNEKHQLNWSNIKSYLVVMPGGMKFISFMLDFVHFIIKELIKQKEKPLNLDSFQQYGIVSEINLQKMCKMDSLFKDMGAGFIVSINVINKSRQIKIETITKYLEKLAGSTKVAVDLLADDTFLSEFEQSNSVLCKQQFTERNEKVFNMDKMVFDVRESMEKFYSIESGLQCDKQKFSQQLKQLRHELCLENISEAFHESDDSITVNTWIKILNGVIGTIRSELAIVNKRPRTGIVHSRLVDIQKDLKDLELQITEFLMVIKSKLERRQELLPQTPVRSNPLTEISSVNFARPKSILENTLHLKYVATPPIKLELPGGHHGPSRLSLFDGKVTSNATSTFGSFLAPPQNMRQTKYNISAVEHSAADLNNTINRSKLIDPMQLLRSINKDTSKTVGTPKFNISSLGSKWKDRQALFMDKENEVPLTTTITVSDSNGSPGPQLILKSASKLENNLSRALFTDKDGDISSTSTVKKSFATSASSTILQSPMTPFSSNDHTRICRSQLQLLESYSASNQATLPSWTSVKKLSAVKKVQDDSLYFANLSTSPSGRLEALVTAKDINIPIIKLNDLSLIDNNTSLNKSIANINDCEPSLQENEKNSNNSISAGCVNEIVESKIQDEEDAIFNISDSILKDVTM